MFAGESGQFCYFFGNCDVVGYFYVRAKRFFGCARFYVVDNIAQLCYIRRLVQVYLFSGVNFFGTFLVFVGFDLSSGLYSSPVVSTSNAITYLVWRSLLLYSIC
jgi:hypothetical protein